MLKFLKSLYTFKNSINFVYSDTSRYYGTTVMRGEQLSKITQKYIRKPVHFTSTDYKYKNCILYLPKWTVYSLKEIQFQKLKENQNTLIFDMLDGELPEIKIKYADIVIAPSKTILESYKKQLPKNKNIFLIDHHVDPRIKNIKWTKRPKTIRVAYFGEVPNAVITPKIKQVVDVIPVSNLEQKTDWFNKLPNYNLHYAIRQKRDVYPNKAFIKGFTAAHCGANILIQDSEKEAVRWLGKNYPYLLKGKVTERKILNMLSYIQKSYGSKEWKRGLEIMEKIKKQTSEKVIGNQIVKVFEYCNKVLATKNS